MKSYLTGCIFLFLTNILFCQFQEIHRINVSEAKNLSDFVVVKEKNNNNFILFLTKLEDEKQVLFIFNDKYKQIYKKVFNEFVATFSTSSNYNYKLVQQKYFYFISEKYIYQLNLAQLNIDSLLLPLNRYKNLKNVRHLYADNIDENEVLIFDYEKGVDIYKLTPFSLLYSFSKEFHDKGYGAKPIITNGNIIYINKKNELISKNLIIGTTNWVFNAGKMDMKFLGINIGAVENGISENILVEEKTKEVIIISTMRGDLIKIDANNGKIIKKIEKIAGDDLESFAGVINYFSLSDFNKDSIVDFLGSSPDKQIYCINGKNLSIFWKKEFEDKCGQTTTIDVNDDSIQDVFLVNNSKLYVLNGKNGKVLFQKNISNSRGNILVDKVVLCDIDNDNSLNVIVLASSQELVIFEMENVKVPKGIIVGAK